MSLLDDLSGEIEEEKQISIKKDLSPVQDAGDYVIVRNIECVDADGNVFEKHDELWIPKDVERDKNYVKSFSVYGAIVHCEEKGNDWFLPSAAATLNYLLKIFPKAVRKRSDGNYHTINEEFKKVLDIFYNGQDQFFGVLAQNSLVAFGKSEIIHYPKKEDFTYASGDVGINFNRDSIRLEFDNSNLEVCCLLDGLENKGIERFVRQYSGVANPEELLNLGDYYGWLSNGDKHSRLWFSSNYEGSMNFSDTFALRIFCDTYNPYLNICADINLDNSFSASGVRYIPPS